MLRTAREVEAKIRAGVPGKWAVGDGAYLQVAKVAKRSTASWLFRFDGRSMGLGPVGLVSLAEAREKARQARRLRLDGIDPLEAKIAKRRQAGLAAAHSVTFADCAERYIKSHAAGWRNPKHRAQWTATLSTYAYPLFGEIAVADVDTGLVLKALEPIWSAKPETASRVRGRIEAVLDWAKARGYREGENPARWRGHLDKLLPARHKVRKVEHHASLPYVELPVFMGDLRQQAGMAARALEFAILTAARTGEAIAAEWSEIDLDARLWIVPGDRMKGRRTHRVPLSDRAIEVLGALPRIEGSAFVFPGAPRNEKDFRHELVLKALCLQLRLYAMPLQFESDLRKIARAASRLHKAITESDVRYLIPALARLAKGLRRPGGPPGRLEPALRRDRLYGLLPPVLP